MSQRRCLRTWESMHILLFIFLVLALLQHKLVRTFLPKFCINHSLQYSLVSLPYFFPPLLSQIFSHSPHILNHFLSLLPHEGQDREWPDWSKNSLFYISSSPIFSDRWGILSMASFLHISLFKQERQMVCWQLIKFLGGFSAVYLWSHLGQAVCWFME